MAHAYDPKFMDYADRSSRYAAQRIGKLLLDQMALSSVLDIGCAKGTWLDVWRELGVVNIQGVDGDYVARDQLLINADEFRASDLSQPLNLGRRFDLVQSLEVAEHIPEAAALTFVQNLINHSRGIVLFSAAPPGQGGEFHVNEQPYDYWRDKFKSLGFSAYDYLRPLIAADPSISFWYRYNIFIYIKNELADDLSAPIRAARVSDNMALSELSPALFRARKYIVQLLPERLRDGLARFKANYLPSGRW